MWIILPFDFLGNRINTDFILDAFALRTLWVNISMAEIKKHVKSCCCLRSFRRNWVTSGKEFLWSFLINLRNLITCLCARRKILLNCHSNCACRSLRGENKYHICDIRHNSISELQPRFCVSRRHVWSELQASLLPNSFIFPLSKHFFVCTPYVWQISEQHSKAKQELCCINK